MKMIMKTESNNTITQYNCPLCQAELKEQNGSPMHPNDSAYGKSLYCPNIKCPAQEVSGHGDNVKQAFEVITAKFNKRQEAKD
jgi:hypothetical protein